MNGFFEREVRKLCEDLEWEEVVLVLLNVLYGANGNVYDDFKMSIEVYKNDKKKKEIKEEESTEKMVNQEKRGITVHELKISPKYYNDVVFNKKRFEIRKDDRNYQVGDLVTLMEYENGLYTGRQMANIPIRYILRDAPEYGLMDGYCILGL